MSIKRAIDSYLPLVLMVFVSVLYLTTTGTRLVSYGDSAEFMTAACTLGVPHAPGYPLYMLVGWLVSRLPWRTTAQGFNVLSACLGIATVWLVYLSVWRIFQKRMIATLTALTLAVSYHFWLYSLVPEIAALNAFFLASIVTVLLGWRETGSFSTRRLYGLALLCGLSLTHHHTILLVFPGMLLYLVQCPKRSVWRFKEVGLALMYFGLGLLPYAYVPLAAMHDPFINNLKYLSWPALLQFVMRQDYGTFLLASEYSRWSAAIAFKSITAYFGFLLKSFSVFGLLLGGIGTMWYWKYRRQEWWLLFLSFVLTGPVFYLLTRIAPRTMSEYALLEKFCHLSFVLFALLLAGGFSQLVRWLQANAALKKRQGEEHFDAVVWIVAFMLPAWLLSANIQTVDKKNYTLSSAYVQDLFAGFASDALVFIHGDSSLFSAWYWQKVEKHRADVEICNDDYYQVRQALQGNVGNRPVYLVGVPGGAFREIGVAGNPYVLQPRGLSFEVVGAKASWKSDAALWEKFRFQGQWKIEKKMDYYMQETLWFYAIAHYNRAVTMHGRGLRLEARAAVNRALAIYPDFKEARDFSRTLERERTPSHSGELRERTNASENNTAD